MVVLIYSFIRTDCHGIQLAVVQSLYNCLVYEIGCAMPDIRCHEIVIFLIVNGW